MSDIEKDAAEYADAEYARIDDPALSDIQCWERHLGIDDAATRSLFDERLVMRRAGIDVEPLFNENERVDAEAVAKTVYAEYAAQLRNPAPHVPHDDLDRLDAIVVQEAFSRDALKKHLFRERRDALRAEEAEREAEREAEQRRESRRAMNLAIPVTIEGELLPRY